MVTSRLAPTTTTPTGLAIAEALCSLFTILENRIGNVLSLLELGRVEDAKKELEKLQASLTLLKLNHCAVCREVVSRQWEGT